MRSGKGAVSSSDDQGIDMGCASDGLAEARQVLSTSARNPVWPQSLSAWALAKAAACGLLALLGAAGGGLAVSVGDLPMAIVGGAIAVGIGAASFALAVNAGLQRPRLSRHVRALADGDEVGIEVRSSIPVVSAAKAFFWAATIYALSAFALWYVSGISLIPDRASSASGANYMGVSGLVTLAALVWIENVGKIDLFISPSGITWVRRRLFRSFIETKVAWDDIKRVWPTVRRTTTRGGAIESPVIRLDTNRPLQALPANLAVEPNALFVLIQFMAEQPDKRQLLSDPDARVLLTPLPLRERWEIARRMRRESKENKSKENSGGPRVPG